MGFNCLRAAEPLLGDSLLFTIKSPGVPGTHLIKLTRQKDERLSQPWSHLAVLNLRPLDWDSITLTSRPLLHKVSKFLCVMLRENNNKVDTFPMTLAKVI